MASALTLGIDPGSYKTGFAVLEQQGRKISVVESGTYYLKGGSDLSLRLSSLLEMLQQLFGRFKPSVVAVEDIFTAKNARSALALGHARGVVLALSGYHQIPIQAYPPATVKKVVVGHGRADKDQVQRMVQVLLSLEKKPQQDEADAMAIAICHILCSKFTKNLVQMKESLSR